MALLKIGDSPTLDLKANIQGASGCLMLLLKGDSDELREIIQTHMGNSFSLAKWFSLYIALLYEQLHRPEFYPRDEFLNTIGNIHVIKLHHELVIQYADIKQLEEDKHKTLARFNLIVTIISILEAMQPLPLDKVLVIREKMLREPKAWVGDIAAILVGLQDIDQDGRPTAAILKKINNAINGTLRCLGFEGDNTLLITQVRDVLFAQNYISWGEKKHCCRATLFAAPKESIDVSTIEDLDVSTIEDLDVSTIEDWEQQELDRQDYEMYNAC